MKENKVEVYVNEGKDHINNFINLFLYKNLNIYLKG